MDGRPQVGHLGKVRDAALKIKAKLPMTASSLSPFRARREADYALCGDRLVSIVGDTNGSKYLSRS
jgi:hypothetical protein